MILSLTNELMKSLSLGTEIPSSFWLSQSLLNVLTRSYSVMTFRFSWFRKAVSTIPLRRKGLLFGTELLSLSETIPSFSFLGLESASDGWNVGW